MKQIYTKLTAVLAASGLIAALAVAGTPHESPETSRRSPAEAKVGERAVRLPLGARPFTKTPRFPAQMPGRDKSADRLPASGPELYGSVINNDGTPGLYKLPTSSSASMTMKIPGVVAQSALLMDGQYYAINPGDFYDGPSVDVYDMETGAKVSSWAGAGYDVSLKNYGIDRDPVTGDIYGVFYDDNGYEIELAKVSFNGATMSRTETVGTLSAASVWYGFAFDADGQLWGIAGDSWDLAYLYKIDKTTARMDLIGSTGFEPSYNTSACFDRENNVLYWSVAYDGYYEEEGALTTVNLTTGKATKIYEYPDAEVVGGMVIATETAAAGVPGECADVAAEFPGGSLSGNIVLTAPATLRDGSDGSGALTVNVKCGGEVIASQTAGWGAQVSVPVTMPEPGIYNFSVYASNGSGDGKVTILNNIFVGPDSPKATEASLTYSDGMMSLSWTPVTESVNGGWIDLASLTYTVTRYPGNVEVATGLTGTTFSEEIAEPDAATQFYYEVVAVCGDARSAAARSNTIALGAIVPPYTSDFANGLEGYTVIDSNNDGNKWTPYDDDGDIEMRIKYNRELEMDDWLITPAVKLEAGKSYKFSVRAHCNGSNYPERLEVMYGTAPTVEAMANTVIPATDITTALNKKYEGVINAPESGKYYIGFHGISDADQYYLFISEFTIEAGEALSVPAAPANLTVAPAADCSLNAAVSVTAPSLDIYGESLSALDKVEIYRDGELVKSFSTVTPGQELSYTDNVSENKEYTYSAYAYNSYGKSEAVTATAYIGVRLPGQPKNVKARRTENVGEVTITWDSVTEDEEGNPLNPELVSYVVALPDGENFTPISTALTGNSFTYTYVEEGSQALVLAAVFPMTAAGTGYGTYSPIIPAGTPYDSFHESFALNGLDLLWYMDGTGGGRWVMASDSSSVTAPDGDGGMIAMQGSNLDDNADLISGLVNLSAFDYPELSFKVYNQTSGDTGFNSNVVMVSLLVDGQPTPVTVMEKTVGELAAPKSWGTVNIDLSAYEGKTIQVMFSVIVKMYQVTYFDDIRIESQQVAYPAPRNLTAENSEGYVQLAWEAPAFDAESPVKPEHLLGYKVYRDNQAAFDGANGGTRYEDYDVQDKNSYTYHVTALYTHGESEPSNKVLHSVSISTGVQDATAAGVSVSVDGTDIVIANAEGLGITVADAAGKVVYRGKGAFRTVVKASAGIYMATVGGRTFKLIVK